MRRLAPVLAAAAVALAGGCASTKKVAPVAPAPGDVEVQLVGLRFKPDAVTVPKGTRVVWRWTDGVVHNIKSDRFQGVGNIGGPAYALTFTEAGSFPYRCTLHEGMSGTVTVTP
jgi:plastocyanin